MVEIGNIYGVPKSTIFNIKRKRAWKYLLTNYNFNIKEIKSKKESDKQRKAIEKLLKTGMSVSCIIDMGYSKSVVYGVKNKK